jgi:hypothetical protein
MKVGDLVRVRHGAVTSAEGTGPLGIITDALQGEDGFFTFEVVFGIDRGWFSDLELELIVP